MPLWPGDRLGNYRLVDRLATGGMGQVWHAVDERTNRAVALKVLSEELSRNEAALARFEREARAVASLQHPNVITLYEFDREGEVPYVVTELLSGRTLRAWIDAGRPPWPRAVEIISAIASGLEAAHSRGVIHRDLKPENVFITDEGQVKILDFGLARIPFDEERDETLRKGDTEPGTLVGTARYMSPEQARGETLAPSSDVFSLGAILYELLTGVSPFDRGSLSETLVALMMSSPTPPARIDEAIPPELSEVVMAALARNRRKRIQTARALIAALEGIGDGAVPARSLTQAWREGHAIDSLAVLPFHAAHQPPNDYLGDGFTETLIYALSSIPRLRVMAPSTSFHYRDRDPLIAGRELGVDAVVSGRILADDEALSVRVELIDVGDGSLIWGDLYLGSRSLLSAVHREISYGISKALRPDLSSSERDLRSSRAVPEHSEAYRNYMRGRQHWNKRTPQALHEAIALFQRAIEEEPGFAPAWSGVADCYSLLCFYRALRPRDGFQRAKAATEKALALDPMLAEAHASLGYIRLLYEWDLEGAQHAFESSLSLNANYPTAHHWYSHVFEALGEHDRALVEIRRAQELDPLSTVVDEIIGFHLMSARRYEEACAHLQRIIELDPRFARTWFDLADLFFLTGERKRAVEHEVEGLRHLSGSFPDADALEEAFERGGVEGYLEENLAQLAARPGYRSPVETLTILLRLGRIDEALDALESAIEERSEVKVFLGRPHFDPLREHSRFRRLREM